MNLSLAVARPAGSSTVAKSSFFLLDGAPLNDPPSLTEGVGNFRSAQLVLVLRCAGCSHFLHYRGVCQALPLSEVSRTLRATRIWVCVTLCDQQSRHPGAC